MVESTAEASEDEYAVKGRRRLVLKKGKSPKEEVVVEPTIHGLLLYDTITG